MRKDIIKTKIKEIEESLTIVEENLPENLEEFLELGLIKDGIYKKIEFCIENIFDICAVINTDLKLGIPEGDESIIDNLVRKKIITPTLGENLKSMRGFRNILVHRYGRINDDISFKILKEHLQDFYKFIDEIEEFLSAYHK